MVRTSLRTAALSATENGGSYSIWTAVVPSLKCNTLIRYTGRICVCEMELL